jgi:hypothetical protein
MVDRAEHAERCAVMVRPADSRGHFIEVRCDRRSCTWSTIVTGHGAADAALLVHQRTHDAITDALDEAGNALDLVT